MPRKHSCSSAGLGVFNERTSLLLSVRHAGPAEASVRITRRSPVLLELRRRLFGLDLPDHGEGVLQPVRVGWLCCGQEGDSGGPGLHGRRCVDPGRTRRTNAGLIQAPRGAVFVPSVVGTVPCSRVPQRLRVWFKADCQRRNRGIKCIPAQIFIINTDGFYSCVNAERVLWETNFN